MVEGTTHLTVLDMLDVLEGEIVLLRTQNESLTAALSNANHELAGTPPTRQKARRAQTRKSKKATKRRKPNASGKAVSDEASVAPRREDRVLGKRQALGRSLLQIRRSPIAQKPAAPEPTEAKSDSFHS